MKMLKIMIPAVMMAMSVSAAASDKVTTIEGKQGKEVSISVESNPSTGYSWMIKSLPDELIYAYSNFEQSAECKKGEVGCPGKETFTFIANKSGKGVLRLIYGQAFDKSTWEESEVKVNIK
ncbi:protease inhibitor I42 family protein [Pantoea ananatis]|uniref:protease inhibitor I42 family protein n=1 Tax=Pantoea ananas TaxID=553 RepID=UPI000CF50585|nr:protease inhibitor I42 family protein [Pantoea ananatis]PQK94909.1 chagasin [Pantoea ananatis]